MIFIRHTNNLNKASVNQSVQLYRNMSNILEKKKILITRSDIPSTGIDLLKAEYDLTIWNKPSPAPRDFLIKNIEGKNGVFCCLTDKIDAELLEAAGSSLKVISTYSVGYDHIDIVECKKRLIRIGYTPDVLTEATAELTLGLLLCTSRRLIEAQHEAKSGGWTSWSPDWLTGPGLSQSTVGIVGFGRIGQSVALKVRAFKPAKILYSNRSDKSNEAAESQAQRVDFDQLIRESDFVICCCALTEDSVNLFDMNKFMKMKKNAIFINTSRGGLVDQAALIKALETKTIRGAGLDVTSPEPLPLESPLFQLSNCVILPHIGSASIEARAAMSKLTAENIISALKENPMPAELI